MHGWVNLAFIVVFFILLVLSLYFGKYLSSYHLKHYPKDDVVGHKMLKGAIFALMGLLVAFTFATANQKLDKRRELIVEEANAIGTAYLRLDLLSPKSQNELRDDFKSYLNARIETYKVLPDIDMAMAGVSASIKLQNKIWNESVTNCKTGNQQSICMLLLPALNNMFDIANKRLAVTRIHPPFVIFYLLVGLACLSCFLAGYDLESKSKKGSGIFVVCYSLVMSLIIYIIIDMEYPRLGIIRLNAFDNTMVELMDSMKN